jgi:hypothetical protein
MSSQLTTESPQVKVVRTFIEGFRKRDVDLIASQLHKDLRRIYHPRSLGMPEQNREEYVAKLTEFISIWADDSEASDTC